MRRASFCKRPTLTNGLMEVAEPKWVQHQRIIWHVFAGLAAFTTIWIMVTFSSNPGGFFKAPRTVTFAEIERRNRTT